jgi:predicted transcriptional regulator
MWHRVDVVLTDVSEERIASIFRVEGEIRKSASEEPVRAGANRLMLEINSAI